MWLAKLVWFIFKAVAAANGCSQRHLVKVGHRAAVQALLTEVRELRSPEQLQGWVADHKPRLSLSFLQWMAGLEARAQGQEQEQLSLLCGQLVAAREGLGERLFIRENSDVSGKAGKPEGLLLEIKPGV